MILLFLLLVPSSIIAQDICTNPRYERREHSIEEIPFIAYIEYKNLVRPNVQPFHTAGTIIDLNMVLTRAVHCEVGSASTFYVYPGQNYVSPLKNHHTVSEYVIHPGRGTQTYDQRKTVRDFVVTYKMDFCLLRLKNLIELSAAAQLAPLPLPKTEIDYNRKVMISGWGPYRNVTFIHGQRAAASNLRYAGLLHHMAPIESDADCAAALKTENITKTPEVFCTGYRCKDRKAVYGDDGGPVFDVVTQTVVGIVGNFKKWETLEKPSINFKITHALEWINQHRLQWRHFAHLVAPGNNPEEKFTFLSHKQKAAE